MRLHVKLASAETDEVPAGWPINTAVAADGEARPRAGFDVLLTAEELEAHKAVRRARYDELQEQIAAAREQQVLPSLEDRLAVLETRVATIETRG